MKLVGAAVCLASTVLTIDCYVNIGTDVSVLMHVLFRLQFNCTEKCPTYAPYKEAEKNEAGEVIETVCVVESPSTR